MMLNKVSIIVLNWNGFDDTISCIQSFLHLQYPNYELIVVDNCSTDDSIRRIKEKFLQIRLIAASTNSGYSGGNNLGIKEAVANGAEYILIVNNDTKLINPNFVRIMVDKMNEDPAIGIMGPKVLNPGAKIQDTILFSPTLLNCLKESFRIRLGSMQEKNYDLTQDVDVVSGVCWIIKSQVIEEVGYLDEDYFMYVEEQDYCYRAKKRGWKIKYFPVESIVHYKEPVDNNIERRYRQYIYARRNQVLFLYKHFGFVRALALAAMFLLSNILKVIVNTIKKTPKKFYTLSLLSALIREFKYVLRCQWK